MQTIDTKRLRQKLLDLAVRGKLVSQDPTDEPASVLLERIREERAELVRAKKAKVPKGGESVIYRASDGSRYEKRVDAKGRESEPVCIDDEIPFEVPEGWEWARLGFLMEEPRYGTSKKSQPVGIMPVLRMGNITPFGTVDYSNLSFTSDASDIETYELRRGDVLFNRTNSKEWVGKTAYYDGAVPCIFAGYLVRVRPICISGRYLNLVMCAPYERKWCSFVKTDGVNQSNINAQKLKKLLVPVPPLAEQRRIVAKLERLLGLVDGIERDSADLEALKARARTKVLDLAVRGRLAPQDPRDEPASALLARVSEERRALVESGKAKAPKGGFSSIYRGSDGAHYEKRLDSKGRESEPVCIDGEIPFEVPRGWEWARVRSLANLINGKAFKPSDWTTDGLPIVRIQNLNNPSSSFNHYDKNVTEDFRLHGGELLFAWSGTPGTSFGAHIWYGGEALLNQHIFKVEISQANLDKGYLKFAFNNRVLELIERAHGSAGLQHITRIVFESVAIPVPPLAEQRRIVEMVEKTYQLLA